MQPDLSNYREQQRRAWGSSIGLHRLSGNFQPASERLLEALAVDTNDRLLDIATGTGRTAVLARARGAHVDAQDLSPVLLGEAAHHGLASGFSDINLTESDAEELPFPAQSFTVVVSTFGVIHAPRPDVACAEINRVLVYGGRLGLATWSFDAAIFQLTRLVPGAEPGFRGAVEPSEWGRKERVREFLSNRYFQSLQLEKGTLELHYPSVDAAWRDWSRNYGPIRAAYQTLPLRHREAIDNSARTFFMEWTNDEGQVAWPLDYLLVRAQKIGLAERIG